MSSTSLDSDRGTDDIRFRKVAKSCLNCRRRKIKCDAAKPSCGACSNSSTFKDCEYTRGPPTRTQRLLARISDLESRLAEMGQPTDRRTHTEAGTKYDISLLDEHISPNIAGGYAYPLDYCVMNPFLIREFLQNRSNLTAFFDASSYYSDAKGTFRAHAETVLPALMDTTRLWSVHSFAPASHPMKWDLESMLAQRVIWEFSVTRVSTNETPLKIVLEYVQALVFFSQYLFGNAEIEEGKKYANAALSVALEFGLNNSLQSPPDSGAYFTANAFWGVFALKARWEAATASNDVLPVTDDPSFSATVQPLGLQWERDMSYYRGILLNDLPDNYMSSSLFLLSKTALFWQQCSLFKSQFPGVCLSDSERCSSQFRSLECDIRQFIKDQSKTRNMNMEPKGNAMDLVIDTMARVALIELHQSLTDENPVFYATKISAARDVASMVSGAKIEEWKLFDPILAVLWSTVCDFLLAEITKIYDCRAQTAIRLLSASRELDVNADLLQPLQTVMKAMSVLSKKCRLMELHASRIHDMYVTMMTR